MSKNTRRIASLSIFSIVFFSMSIIKADDDHHSYRINSKPNSLHQQECGSCHFAYQAALLPSRSWQKIMTNLAQHFGDNAELDAPTRQSITQYLTTHAADKVNYRISKKFLRSLSSNQSPLRISKLPYFMKEHREMPKKMVKGNPQVGSLSRCDACHTQAKQGDYSERSIKIPGYGYWDD